MFTHLKAKNSIVLSPASSNELLPTIRDDNFRVVLEIEDRHSPDLGPEILRIPNFGSYSIPNANPDNFGHLRESSTRENRWQLGWEDLLYGGDQSFMDAVINLELAIADAILGDINNDGTIDFLDIGPFVNLLLRGSYSANADFDRNGIVDFQDIAPFVNTLQRN